MGTTVEDKPVVLVASGDTKFCSDIEKPFTEMGNFVTVAPTLDDMVVEVHKNESARMIICVDSKVSHFQAIITYLDSVAHRSMKYVFAEESVDDALHIWAVKIKKAYGSFNKKAVDLKIFARDANITPVWDLLAKLSKDPMTGLASARGFEDTVRPQLEMMRDGRLGVNASASVMMLDADWFKDINDTCGHLKGDEAIKVIADALRTHVRPTDHPCRRSGDEFLIWLPGLTKKRARRIGEKLEREVTRAPFFGRESERVELAISFGIADIRSHEIGNDIGKALERLIDRADLQMNEAKKRKKAGR